MAQRPAGEADDPAERTSFPRLVWRILMRFDSQQMFHHSAALTYYTMLALFPSLLVAVALLGIFGQENTVTQITGYLSDQGAPASLIAPVSALLHSVVRARSGASFTLIGSLLLALFGASGAFAASRRALNVAFGVEESRAIIHRKLGDMAATLVLIVLAVVILVLVFLGGGVADDLFRALGLGGDAAGVWAIARWPAAAGVMLVAYAFVYDFAPDVETRRFRTFSPGALIAVPLWIGVSAGFFVYVSNLGSLQAYGVFASAIVLLIWLYLSSAALLLGAQINAVVTFADRAGRGGPPPVTPPPQARELAAASARADTGTASRARGRWRRGRRAARS